MRSDEVDTEFAYDPLGRRLLKHSTPKLPIGAGAQAAVNPAWVASETARLSRQHNYGVTLYGWDDDQIAWEGDAETTTHYVFEPGSFVPLLPTPDWSERDYDIDADPLWTYSPEPQPFEQLYYYGCLIKNWRPPRHAAGAARCRGQSLAWSADYKAWGEAKAAISEAAKKAGISNPLRFQGQYFDHETGLHYNRHRYYDPQIGRFISKDPIGLHGGLNIFAYAPNPVEWVDPWGLSTTKPSVKYSRALYGGTQTDSPAAQAARAAGEGQPCPTCGNIQISNTPTAPSPQHEPTLVEHYYGHGGHAMGDDERRTHARECGINGTQCITCQRKEGAAMALYSKRQKAKYNL